MKTCLVVGHPSITKKRLKHSEGRLEISATLADLVYCDCRHYQVILDSPAGFYFCKIFRQIRCVLESMLELHLEQTKGGLLNEEDYTLSMQGLLEFPESSYLERIRESDFVLFLLPVSKDGNPVPNNWKSLVEFTERTQTDYYFIHC